MQTWKYGREPCKLRENMVAHAHQPASVVLLPWLEQQQSAIWREQAAHGVEQCVRLMLWNLCEYVCCNNYIVGCVRLGW
jgi:hypothetical protein